VWANAFESLIGVGTNLPHTDRRQATMAGEARQTGSGIGLTLGGGIVLAGILIAIFWSVVIGVIVALVGLLAFGGFARGRWY
jgi:Flp pilus assembly protein TadB